MASAHHDPKPRGRSVTNERPLSPGVTALEGRRGGLYPFVNAFRLDPPNGETCIIDPGFGHSDYIQKHLGEFRHVVNSHFHPEHTTYNRLFSVPARIHPLDAPPVMDIDVNQRYYGLQSEPAGEEWREWLVNACDWIPAPATAHLTQEFIDTLGFEGLRLLHTPGHTPGHVCLFFESRGLLLSFDFDFVPQGPWFGHACSDPDDWLKSIHTLIALEPEDVFVSHQPAEATRGNGTARLREFLETFNRREDELVKFLAEPRDMEAITRLGCRMFYADLLPRPRSIWEYFARTTLRKHAERLERLGRVARCDPEGSAFRAV